MKEWLKNWVQLIIVVAFLGFFVMISMLAAVFGVFSFVMFVISLIFLDPLCWLWLVGTFISLLIVVGSWKIFVWLAGSFVTPIGQGQWVEVIEPWC